VFLQAIWDTAIASSQWPTFAELERRLDGHHAIKAWDALSGLPEGFVVGVSATSPYGRGGERIGLTVPGAAACAGTGDALTALVQFVRAAAQLEQGSPWLDRPGRHRSGVAVEEFAKRANLPMAGRAQVLRGLILLLQVQPWGWTIFEDPESAGHLRVAFDSRVRIFRGVADVDDYWTVLPWSRKAAGADHQPGANVSGLAEADAEFERLAGEVYAGLREGRLRAEDAFDLACFLLERRHPDPVVQELAEHAVAGTDPQALAGLARRTLDAANFTPDFELEPSLLAALERALEIVKADLRATGIWGTVALVVVDGVNPRHAQVRFRGEYTSSTTGVAPSAGREPPLALLAVAEDLQDAVIEALWAPWPVCPIHNMGAHPRPCGDTPVWWCNGGDGHVIAVIGQLAAGVTTA
jgi:hypothetical protein